MGFHVSNGSIDIIGDRSLSYLFLSSRITVILGEKTATLHTAIESLKHIVAYIYFIVHIFLYKAKLS